MIGVEREAAGASEGAPKAAGALEKSDKVVKRPRDDSPVSAASPATFCLSPKSRYSLAEDGSETCAASPPHMPAEGDAFLPSTRPRDVERDTGRFSRRSSLRDEDSEVPRDRAARSPSPPIQRHYYVDSYEKPEERRRTRSPSPVDRSPSPRKRARTRSPSPYSPAPYYEGEWQQPSSLNPETNRTLVLKYWERTSECTARKKAHLARIDAEEGSRETWVLRTTLKDAPTALEPNPFPYATPRGIEHWTLWSVAKMTESEIDTFVSSFISNHERKIYRWNFDWNEGNFSIELFHVHVYLQTVPDDEVDWDVGKYVKEEEDRYWAEQDRIEREERAKREREYGDDEQPERGRKRTRWDVEGESWERKSHHGRSYERRAESETRLDSYDKDLGNASEKVAKFDEPSREPGEVVDSSTAEIDGGQVLPSTEQTTEI